MNEWAPYSKVGFREKLESLQREIGGHYPERGGCKNKTDCEIIRHYGDRLTMLEARMNAMFNCIEYLDDRMNEVIDAKLKERDGDK